MRFFACLAVPLALAACTLPGRQSFVPAPITASPADIAATKAFDGRLALVTIPANDAAFAAPLKTEVVAALAIKPGAAFEVVGQCPVTAPDDAAACLSFVAAGAQNVSRFVVADGVPSARVSVLAREAGTTPLVLVYVK